MPMIKTRKFWSRTAVIALAVSAALSTATAADHEAATGAKPDYVVTYRGDPVLCPRLLQTADQVRYIEPYMDTGYALDLLIGENGTYRTRLYFTHRPMSPAEMDPLIERRDWIALLGYVPPQADTTPGYVVGDPRWRPLRRKCPDFFQDRDPKTGEVYAATERVALYRADLDNDGAEDTVLLQEFVGVGPHSRRFNQYFSIADLETCSREEMLSRESLVRLLTWQGKTFVEVRSRRERLYGGNNPHNDRAAIYHKTSENPTKFVYRDLRCDFSGFNSLAQFREMRRQFSIIIQREN